ncbi:hypothetical protein TNCV_3267701 [Trichonephila clavipes]|nr:hypothetical protein TNCV_3267701 [Trichonephila clavipes]
MKDRAVHRRQPLRIFVVKGVMMEGMASIQRRYHTFRKQKVNHCLPFLLGANRQWSCHVERYSTLQRLREKTSGTLYRSVVRYPSSIAEY